MPTFDPTRSALLAMDCQRGIVSIYARDDRQGFVTRAARVVAAGRSAGLTIVHVRVGFRPALPEVSDRNALFAPIKASAEHQQLFQGEIGAIEPTLGPEASDIVVIKHRVDAFHGTDLEVILRARDIDTLILFGIATSGVVLSTLLRASDADYRLAVIGDCCADLDQELHACLLERLFPRRATVLSAAEFVEAVTGQRADA
jgi:nicotinamidase-related amidase